MTYPKQVSDNTVDAMSELAAANFSSEDCSYYLTVANNFTGYQMLEKALAEFRKEG